MKLYYAETINPRKACAVVRHLGLPVELINVDLAHGEHKSPAFLALNPNGRVPVLQDGELTLWEANAIMCHLSRRAGASLWPQDAAAQVEVMRWLSWDAFHFLPHGAMLYFQHVVKPNIGMGEADEAVVTQSLAGFRQSAAVLDAHLAGNTYALGDALSVADFALAAALPWAKESKLPLEEFPAIRRWHTRMEQVPGWLHPFAAA